MKNIKEEDNIKEKERLKVTCIERKYRVDKPDLSFTITANKELDEDTTSNLLHEDMELKTFLSNYEITDIISSGTDVIKKPIIAVKNGKDSVIETVEELPEETVDEIPEETREEIRDYSIEELRDKREISTTNLCRQNKKRTFHPQTHTTSERRALFDYLNLPKQFTCRNYIDALGKKGAKVTNTAMPYDDLKYFERIGKIEKIEKAIRGVMVWERISQDQRVDFENIEEVGKREERRDIPIFI